VPRAGADEVEHVELPAGMGEEVCEVPHALEVADAHRLPFEDDRPVVALAAEDVRVGGRADSGFDLLEDRPGRRQLEAGVLVTATGAKGLCMGHSRDGRLVGRSDLVP